MEVLEIEDNINLANDHKKSVPEDEHNDHQIP
jgi:hypothetical protein